MKKYKSIRKKIARRMLQTSMIAIALVFLIAAVGITVLRQSAVDISNTLGDSAASDSKHALEIQTTQMLQSLAQDKAKLSDEILNKIERYIFMMADNTEDIITNPDKYKENEISFPTLDDLGKITAYVQLPYGTALSDFSSELGLIANNQNLFRRIIENNSEITSVYMGTENGICITVDEITEPVTSVFDPRERLWYVSAKNNGKGSPVWTDVFEDAFGRGLAIACAKAYCDENGDFSGVVGIGFTLTSIKELVLGAKTGETGYSFILNGKGQIIMSPTIKEGENGEMIRENLLESENETLRFAAEKMLVYNNGVEQVVIDGVLYYLAYDSINTVQWKFASLISVDEAIKMATKSEAHIIAMKNEAINNINYWVLTLSAVFIVVLCVIVAVIVYISRHTAARLTNPITELTEGAKIIGGGNLEYKLNIETEDEIQTLSETFGKMIDDIKHITAEKERIGAELDVATKIQASMLPSIFPPFPNRNEFDIYAKMIPAKEVGGDFYDFFLIDETRLCVVIADVSGKGIPAALFMVIAKTLIKNSAQYGNSPSEIFNIVNNQLCEGNDAGMFVTAFAGILDITTGQFTYVNAGHNPPLIKRNNGTFKWLTSRPGLVLAGMEDITYRQSETRMDKDDMLFLYTDGVTEATNKELELFSNEKLENCLNNYRSTEPREIVTGLKHEIDVFADGTEQADDITMLILKIKHIGSADGFKDLTVTASVDNLDKVIAFITDGHDMDLRTRTQIDTAIEEIFVNIAHYAYAPETGNAYIRVKTEDNLLIFELSDKGKPFNPLDKPDPDITLPTEERAIGGLGIFMVKKTMDEVLYRNENGKNTLTIKKRLK